MPQLLQELDKQAIPVTGNTTASIKHYATASGQGVFLLSGAFVPQQQLKDCKSIRFWVKDKKLYFKLEMTEPDKENGRFNIIKGSGNQRIVSCIAAVNLLDLQMPLEQFRKYSIKILDYEGEKAYMLEMDKPTEIKQARSQQWQPVGGGSVK